MMTAVIGVFRVGQRVRERERARRERRIIAVLHDAREAAEWATRQASAIQFLGEDERERVRRAMVSRFARRRLIPARVSLSMAIGIVIVWPLLGLLVVLASMFALAGAAGLMPHLADEVTIGLGSFRAPLWWVLVAAMAAGVLLAVPNWWIVLRAIARWKRRSGEHRSALDADAIASQLGVTVIILVGLPTLASTVAVVSAADWGLHGRTGIALACGLAAGLSGRFWDPLVYRSTARIFGDFPWQRQDDRALMALAVCAAVNSVMSYGLWRRPRQIKHFRSLVRDWAEFVQRTPIAFGTTRWFEWRVRWQCRNRYRMLGAILRTHADAAITASSTDHWERICQSLVSGLVLIVDGDWDGLLGSYSSLARRDRWLVQLAPRLLTAATTACGAAFLPLLPGLGGTTGSSLRVFLSVAAVLTLLPGGDGYDSVRTALRSSLPWRASK